MPRPAKLTVSQCNSARALRNERHVPVPRLAKKFKVSESSMYKVLDGSYMARKEVGRRHAGTSTRRKAPDTNIIKTPNIFPDIPANQALGTMAGDDAVLQAAMLIVSRSRFAAMVRGKLH